MYALCTTAKCTPKDGGFSCRCDVQQGLSAGSSAEGCPFEPVIKPAGGVSIKSRYYPIRSYVPCSTPEGKEPRGWAFCLDAPCVIDSKNLSKAECSCTKSNAEPYVFVTKHYSTAGCDSEFISSATVSDVQGITEFLKTSPLKPFPIVVLTPPK